MRYLAIIDLNDDDLRAAYGSPEVAHHGSAQPLALIPEDVVRDVTASIDARFDEVYCGPTNDPVRGRLVDGFNVTRLLPFLASALQVGVEGYQEDDWTLGETFGLSAEDVEAAWQIAISLNAGPATEEEAS